MNKLLRITYTSNSGITQEKLLIGSKLPWNFFDITKLHGSSRGFAAFLLNTVLRDTSGGLLLYD